MLRFICLNPCSEIGEEEECWFCKQSVLAIVLEQRGETTRTKFLILLWKVQGWITIKIQTLVMKRCSLSTRRNSSGHRKYDISIVWQGI